LTVNAKGGGQTDATGALAADGKQLDLTVNASSVTVNVTTVASSTTPAVTGSFVALTGDVKTATVNVTNGVDKMTAAGSDISSTVKIAPTEAATGGAFTNLGNLTSFTVAGTGAAIVDNSDTQVIVVAGVNTTVAGSKLATIDASGLFGKKTIAGTTLGDPTAGLTWTASLLAETVKLGSALDALTVAVGNSTYAKIDSITGFTFATDATGVLKTTTSDDITVTASVGGAAVTGFAKAAAGYSTTSLDAALSTLANRTAANTDKVVFQTGGNTYIFVDTTNGDGAGTQNGVQDNDTVIELVGLVDLDNLILALNA